MAAPVGTPHFDLPFRFSSGGHRPAAVTEQDGPKDVLNCVHAILAYPKEFRPELPDFGVDELVFQSNPSIDNLLDQVTDWEPRADLAVLSEVWDEWHQQLRLRLGVG
jgi:hypothetical protein